MLIKQIVKHWKEKKEKLFIHSGFRFAKCCISHFTCGTASCFLWAASKQPLKPYLPKYLIKLQKLALKNSTLKNRYSKTVPSQKLHYTENTVLGVHFLGMQFMRPLRGQKPIAIKTVPQKLPLYKTYDRITGPVNYILFALYFWQIKKNIPSKGLRYRLFRKQDNTRNVKFIIDLLRSDNTILDVLHHYIERYDTILNNGKGDFATG